MAAAFGMILFRLLLSGIWEIRLFFAYVVWLVLTRILNGDYHLQNEFLTVMDICISFFMFACGTQLKDSQQDKFLCALVIVYSGFFVVVCLIGLFISVTNTSLCVNPDYDIWINVIYSAGTNSLVLFSENRLICASWVYIAWALLIYSFFKTKKVALRILILLSTLVVYITIPLFHSRTIQIVMAISCGMLVLLLLLRTTKRLSLSVRIPILTAITVSAIFLGFFSYNWSNSLVSVLRSNYAPRFEYFYTHSEQQADPRVFGIDNSKEIANNMEEQRIISTNSTLTCRTEIWKSGLIAIERDPKILAYGSLSSDLMKPVNKVLREEINPAVKKDKPHMHNMFFQILMLTGLPGLLLIVVWTAILFKKTVQYYFSEHVSILLSSKLLIIPITGVLVWHLVEAGLFTKTDIYGKVFFLLCGVFVSYYNDYFIRQNKYSLEKLLWPTSTKTDLTALSL